MPITSFVPRSWCPLTVYFFVFETSLTFARKSNLWLVHNYVHEINATAARHIMAWTHRAGGWPLSALVLRSAKDQSNGAFQVPQEIHVVMCKSHLFVANFKWYFSRSVDQLRLFSRSRATNDERANFPDLRGLRSSIVARSWKLSPDPAELTCKYQLECLLFWRKGSNPECEDC